MRAFSFNPVKYNIVHTIALVSNTFPSLARTFSLYLHEFLVRLILSGERIKTWRKRWLVLTSDGLFQEYKAPPKSPRDAPTQTFDVAGSAMTAVDDPKAKGGKDQKYGFIIRFGTNVEMTKFIERSFHYDTEEERELWVEQYEKVLKDVHRQSLKVLPDAMPNFQRRNAVASKQGNDASNPEDDDSKPSRKFGLFGRRETKQTKLVTTLQNNAEVSVHTASQIYFQCVFKSSHF